MVILKFINYLNRFINLIENLYYQKKNTTFWLKMLLLQKHIEIFQTSIFAKYTYYYDTRNDVNILVFQIYKNEEQILKHT